MQRPLRLAPKKIGASFISVILVAVILGLSSPAQATQQCIPEGTCGMSPLAWVTGTFGLAPAAIAGSSLLIPAQLRHEHADYWSTVGWSTLASVATTTLAAGVGSMVLNDGDEHLYLGLVVVTPIITSVVTTLLYEGEAPSEGSQTSAEGDDVSTIPWVSVAATDGFTGVSMGWQF